MIGCLSRDVDSVADGYKQMKEDVVRNLHDMGKVRFLLNAWNDRHLLDFGSRLKGLQLSFNDMTRQVMEELVVAVERLLEDIKDLVDPILVGKYNMQEEVQR